MKIANAVLLFSFYVLGQIALAGAWDMGPFDNDDALDWVYELEASNDLSAVKAALSAAANQGAYIEAPTGSAAVAAAEVVAALLGRAHPQLPPEVASWVDGRTLAKDDALVELARTAIARVQDPAESELAELWSESPESLLEWRSSLSDLDGRLQ